MMDYYFLDKQDVALLQGLLDEARANRWDLKRRGKTLEADRWEHQASDSYIATISEDVGVDGLDHFRQGVSGSQDIPGYVLCDIYEVENGVLRGIGHSVPVYNLSEERVRNDWFAVTKTKGGDWVIVNKTVILSGILLKKLEPATNPLSGATVGEALLIEWDTSDEDDGTTYTPAKWKVTTRRLRFVNRSIDMWGAPGTYGKFQKEQGEFNPLVLDCNFSEEALNYIVDVFSDTYGGFTFGG